MIDFQDIRVVLNKHRFCWLFFLNLCIRSHCFFIGLVRRRSNLRAFATDAAGQLDVLGHDGDTLGVDGSQVGILEQAYQVCLGGFLECQDGRSLETKIGLEILGNFTNQTLERKFADQEFRGFLVTTDLTKSYSTRSVTVRFLDTASGRC